MKSFIPDWYAKEIIEELRRDMNRQGFGRIQPKYYTTQERAEMRMNALRHEAATCPVTTIVGYDTDLDCTLPRGHEGLHYDQMVGVYWE